MEKVTAQYNLIAQPNSEFYIRLFSNGISYNYRSAQDAIDNRDTESSVQPYDLEVRLADNDKDGILIDQYEPNDEFDNATPIKIDDEISGTLEPERDLDIYKFSYMGKKKAALNITFENHTDDMAPNLAVYDGNRRALGCAREPKGAFKATYKVAALPEHEFYVSLFSNDISFPYNSVKAVADNRGKERSNKPYKLKIEIAH
jgi:hypothetical protein